MSFLSRHPKLQAIVNRRIDQILHLREHLRLRALLIRLKPFAEHPLDRSWDGLKHFVVWFWGGLCVGWKYIHDGAVTHRVGLFWAGVVWTVVALVLVGSFCAEAIYMERQVVPVAAPDRTVYLGQ